MNRTWYRTKRQVRRRLIHLRTRFHVSQHRTAAATAPPIFVIGCQRSGTSLLRRVLDSHPRIACPPESKFILPLQQLVRDPQALQGLDSMGFAREIVMSRLREFVTSFFQDYVQIKGKARWADKTPNYVDCLQFLDELFSGEAHYIVIVRHPFDVCLSFEHAASKSGKPMPAIETYVAETDDFRAGVCSFWNTQNLKIVGFVHHAASRVISLDYETLTSHPEPVLRQMFGFLGEPWTPRVLDYGRFSHDHGFEDRKIEQMPKIVPNSGRFLAWSAEERSRLAMVAHEAMESLGYTPHSAQRDQRCDALDGTFVQVEDGQTE
jgi:hypothetical protein